MSAATIQPMVQSFTAQDRCDRCGAQAYVRATLTKGGELLFCAHHWGLHHAAVAPLCSDIYEELDRLR